MKPWYSISSSNVTAYVPQAFRQIQGHQSGFYNLSQVNMSLYIRNMWFKSVGVATVILYIVSNIKIG